MTGGSAGRAREGSRITGYKLNRLCYSLPEYHVTLTIIRRSPLW